MQIIETISLPALVLALTSAIGVRAAEAPVDYLNAEFAVERVLDWGERPVWSLDGTKIAFTKSDVQDSPAYEMDLQTRNVRCLTCRWGANGLVTRVYYLPDNSYLLLAESIWRRQRRSSAATAELPLRSTGCRHQPQCPRTHCRPTRSEKSRSTTSRWTMGAFVLRGV